jgi:hypothetical protein
MNAHVDRPLSRMYAWEALYWRLPMFANQGGRWRGTYVAESTSRYPRTV